jgi:hypothetical protein
MFPAYYHNEKARHFDESALVLKTTPEFSTQNSGILLIAAFLTNCTNSKTSKTFKKVETQWQSVADPDPGSGIGFFQIPDLGSQTHIFESFLYLFKNKTSFNFVIL